MNWELVLKIAGILGGLAVAVLPVLLPWQIRKIRAETGKTDAEAAQILTASSAAFASGVAETVAALKQEVAELRREQSAQGRLLRAHEHWDHAVAHQVRQLGGAVTDPPPLYPVS